MIHSDTLMGLAAALAAAQGEFESVAKTANNPFFKSKYAALPDVVKAASPILAKQGLAVTQLIGHDEGGDTLTTVLMHKSGEFIADTMRMRPVKNDPQAQGSAATYARRYSYMAILGLVADEDDDGNSASGRSGASNARRAAARTRTPAEPAAPASVAASAASGASDASGDGDGKALVTEETLGYLAAAYRKAGATAADLKGLLAEAGAEPGTTTDRLTEEQATYIVLALNRKAKERNA